MNVQNKLYRVEATLKFRKDRFLYVDKEIVLDEVTFKPLNPNRKEAGIRVSLIVKCDSEDEAKARGEVFVSEIAAILCLKTNVGVVIEDLDIVEVIEQTAKDNDTLAITITETLKIKSEVSVGIGINEKLVNETIKIIHDLDNIDPVSYTHLTLPTN